MFNDTTNSHRRLVSASSVSLVALVAAMTSAMPARAQDAGTEIIVTAQKRSESVQDIPKPVEVLNQRTLTDAGINNLRDLSRLSPSIQGTGASGAPPAIRGISSFAFSIGVQAQTGIVLDDVPQPTFSTLSDELSDVERVEILPGPQSTLSGRNAAGGLINVVTRSPTSTLEGNFSAEVTDDHQKRFAGYVTGPLSDKVGFSLSGFWNDWDGPLYNRATDHRIGGYDRKGVRGKLRFEPTDRFTATVTGFYVKNNAPTIGSVAGYAYVALNNNVASVFDPRPLTQLGYTASPYNHDVYSAREGTNKSEDYGASLRLEYDADFGTISSISSISHTDNPSTQPLVTFSAATSPFLAPITISQAYKIDYKTQEFRLTSPSGAGPLQYTLGAIYTDTDINQPYQRPVLFPVNWDRDAVTRSFALYGRATYEVVTGTFLTGGLRYQHDYQAYAWDFIGSTTPRSAGSNKYDFIAGEASIRHELNDNVSAYFTYANAQTGKAYDLEDQVSASSSAGLQPLASEKVQNFELGLKTQWLDRRLTVNVTLFNADYKNYQIQSALLPPGGGLPSIRLLSIGKVRTRGAEIMSSFAVTPDLRLSAAATWLDAKIRDYPNPICYTGQTDQTSCVAGTAAYTGLQQNLSGVSMPGAARFKAVGSVNYTLRLPSAPVDLTFAAQGRYQTKTHAFVLNDPASRIGAFGTVNLVVGVQDHDARYKLQLFVNNVFDKDYYATLSRDTVVNPVGGSFTANAVSATYARDSRRYGGLRLSVDY